MNNENKTNINWFPGHMAKAKREISEKIKLVDLVIELKDARIPYSSGNPMIDEIVGNKPRLVLLCKSGIADAKVTALWLEYYNSKNILALDIDCLTKYHISSIIPYAQKALKDVFIQREKKQIKSKQIRAIILGIPNVGKSTLINTLSKRKATMVGDRPGVTKTQTWIKMDGDILLMDTPGILWPKFEDQTVGIKLAMCGSIKDEILDLEYLADQGLKYLCEWYPHLLKERYKLEDLSGEPHQLLERMALKRGFVLKGGIPDTLRMATTFINELRNNRIGEMSYERPNEFESL